MLVSIIIATYNAEKHLQECIESIISQKYINYEIIVIDGKSSDSTVDIINKYSSYITYWISEKDNGIYDAWNKGLSKSTGDWISFIGSDDAYYPNALGSYVSHISDHPNREQLQFVSSKINLVSADSSYLKTVGEPWAWNAFKKFMTTWHVGTFHSRKLFDKYGVFDTTYKSSGDYELLLRAREELVTSFIDVITVKMRNGGISSKSLLLASTETYRAKVKNGVMNAFVADILRFIDFLRLKLR